MIFFFENDYGIMNADNLNLKDVKYLKDSQENVKNLIMEKCPENFSEFYYDDFEVWLQKIDVS